MQPECTASDFVGYEALIQFIKERELYKLDGDIIEIGAFMGGGTAKLAVYARRYNKKVYAVDIFNTFCDQTQDTSGARMSDIYQALLQGRSQLEVYREATAGLDNIITIENDSKEVEFPPEQKFIFGFVDGNHQADYVKNDFYLIWHHLVPGGGIGFHDYRSSLPEVTGAIDRLIAQHRDEISETQEIEGKSILLLSKKRA